MTNTGRIDFYVLRLTEPEDRFLDGELQEVPNQSAHAVWTQEVALGLHLSEEGRRQPVQSALGAKDAVEESLEAEGKLSAIVGLSRTEMGNQLHEVSGLEKPQEKTDRE